MLYITILFNILLFINYNVKKTKGVILCQWEKVLTDLKEVDLLKRKRKEKLSKENRGLALNVELVGIKNLKSTHNYRLEFDVYEIDTPKVKELIDKLNKAFVMGLVEYE